MTKPWDYEGYWNVVLGANRSAADVVREFDLAPGDRRSLDEWLGHSEEAALGASGDTAIPDEWEGFHGRALDALCIAALTDGDVSSAARAAFRASKDAGNDDGVAFDDVGEVVKALVGERTGTFDQESLSWTFDE